MGYTRIFLRAGYIWDAMDKGDSSHGNQILCHKNLCIFFSGAFLIVYFIAMTFCGIPVFFQEVAIGQYLGSGGMTLVAQLCPLLKGVGIATMVLVFFLDIYYCVIIAWTIFYMIATFTQIPALPWDTCGKNHYSIENE